MKALIRGLPKFEITLTKAEVEAAVACAQRHYDGVCKDTALPRGFLYGAQNQIKFCEMDGDEKAKANPTADLNLTVRELDTFCKVLELAHLHESPTKELGPKLYWDLRRVWTMTESRFPKIAIQVP